MKKLYFFFFSLIIIAVLIAGCNSEEFEDNPVSNSNDAGKLSKHNAHASPKLFVSGLQGTLGSVIGPGGDLFIPEAALGVISRIDPRTGRKTTFASGFPQLIPAVGIGGVVDVVFSGRKAYALVTLVSSDVGGNSIDGIYRIDGPNNYTIIADIGAFNLAHPPTGFDFFVPTGVLYAIQQYHGGFLVTDGHFNRILYITRNGDISVFKAFDNIVPTGLEVEGNRIYLAESGPVPHLPENGKVVSFSQKSSVKTIASGAPLLVDVEFGRHKTLFAISQGDFGGGDPGAPALPNTGSLVKVKGNGSFETIAKNLNLPTSLELINNTAYVVTLTGEIWTIKNIDQDHKKHKRDQWKHKQHHKKHKRRH